MERKPDIAERIKTIAEARVGKERVVRGGDIISEELDRRPTGESDAEA